MNNKFRRLAIPYQYWLYILALFPVIIMFVLIFLDTEGISLDEASFTFSNFLFLGEISTIQAFGNSIVFAVVTTLITIVLGYILAYKIFRSKFKNKFLILVILILPMWSNLLLRTEALGNIMEPNNIITNLLSGIGIDININLKGTSLAVLIGLVLTYIPFMVLPVYTSLEKIDKSLEEAALDLGATEFKKFRKVIIPLSSKGFITGSILVFLPSLSGFAIPYVLGKGNIVMIGTLIEQSFREMFYGIGSLLAIIILVLILGSLIIVNKVDKEGGLLL